MTTTVRVEQSADGPLVVVKRAIGAASVERLHREARMLTLAAHPGVVEVVELRSLAPEPGDSPADGEPADGEPAAELRLSHVGPHSLATISLRNASHACGLVAAIAETVADLHSIGIVHGRVAAAHVLIDAEGRPVLGGFAEAALVGEERPPSRASSGRERARPADDLPALGHLLGHLIGAGTEPDPIPERRLGRRTKSRAYTNRALLNLIDQATADDPSLRPSARAFATAIRAVEPHAAFVPPAGLPSGTSTIEAPIVGEHRAAPTDETAPADPATPPSPAPASGTGTGTGTADDLARRPSARSDAAARLSARATRSAHLLATAPAGERVGRRPDGPSARDVAASSAAGRSGDGRTGGRSGRPQRGLSVAVALVGVAAITFGVLSSWHGERPNLAEASPDTPGWAARPTAAATDDPSGSDGSRELPTIATGAASGTVPATTDTRSAAPAPSPGAGAMGATCPTVSAPVEPAEPARMCTRSVVLTDGVLRAGARRFALGEPNDEVLVGDWSCTGTPVPVVLRPSTGEVYLFPAWATPGADVTARLLARRGGGGHLETGPSLDPAGCPVLVVIDGDGSRHDLTSATRLGEHS